MYDILTFVFILIMTTIYAKDIIKHLRAMLSSNISIYYFAGGDFLSKTNGDLLDAVDVIRKKLTDIFESDNRINLYVGIFVRDILYAPPILLGCIELDKPFVFLDVEERGELNINLLTKLQISVILTLSEDGDKIKRLQIPYFLSKQFKLWNHTLQLWIKAPVRREIEEKRTSGDVERMFYAVQTSGSTGKPKIVQVPEKSILPNINDLRREFDITADDVILLSSPPTFDPFMVEVLLALSVGASLFMVPSAVRASPSLFLDCVFPADRPSKVTVMQLTPSVFMRWKPSEIKSRVLAPHTSLRILALGGEMFPPSNFWSSCKHPDNGTQLYNLYGTTEVSCWALVAGPRSALSLGSPLSSTLLRVKSESGLEITEGTGILFIGSKTRICIVEDEDWSQLKPPVYRATGDIVTVKDGVYQYVGREDSLVKRWGHRVCLDQVAAVAAECEGVAAACCVLHAECLGLFVSADLDSVTARLKVLLLSRLNKASIPDVILQEDQLPLNRHGKVNKNKLIQKLTKVMEREKNHRKSVDLFRYLWGQYTLGELRDDTGFLNAGGSSVTAMQIVNRLNMSTTNSATTVLVRMLANTSLAECCRLVESLDSGGGETETVGVTRQGAAEGDQSISRKTKIDSGDDEILQVILKGGCGDFKLNPDVNLNLNINWSYNLGKCVDASPTVIVYKSGQCRVVVGSHSGRLAALDLDSGNNLWDVQLPDRIESSLVPSHCASCGLVGCYDGKVYCVSLTTGCILWSFKTGAMVKAIPLLAGDTWIFGSYDYHVYCLRVADGSLVWRHNTGGIVATTPLALVSLGLVVVASLSGHVVAVDRATGHIQWDTTLPSPVFSSPCVVAGMVVVAEVEGSIHAFLPGSGVEVWKVSAGGKIFSSLSVTDSMVLFGCYDNHIYCLRCGLEGAELLWQHDVGSVVYSTPSPLAPQHLAVATSAGLVSVMELHSGRIVTSIHLPGEIFSSPVVYRDFIVVGCRDNSVHCLRINKVSTD